MGGPTRFDIFQFQIKARDMANVFTRSGSIFPKNQIELAKYFNRRFVRTISLINSRRKHLPSLWARQKAIHKCKSPLHNWIDKSNQFTPVIPSLRLHTSQDIGNTTETDKGETKQANFNGLKFSESMLKNSISSESKITPADVFRDSFIVYPEFITSVEESNIVMEVDPHLTRQVYEKDHWDDAIVGFRETERKNWNFLNTVTIDRMRETGFASSETRLLPYIHVLDLSEDGYIKPHIDSSRFCGDTVAVLSLLSDCILKFVHDKHEDYQVHCLVPRRSLYIMRGDSRYNYTHAILKNEDSYFNAQLIAKGRRISVICRNDVK